MKTILVLTDFSINADHAAHYALKLAQKINANLLLCNVYPTSAMMPAAPEPFSYSDNFGSFEKDSLNDLKELAGRLKQQSDGFSEDEFKPFVELCSKPGPLIPAINDVVAGREISFAVIATHNTDDMLAFLNGNHTHEIIEQAQIPILVLPYQAPFTGFHKIAFTTDLAEEGKGNGILHTLYDLAKYFDSEVLITHVGRSKLGSAAEEYITRQFLREEIGASSYPRIQYKTVENKSAAAGLHWLAKQRDIDLVVLVHRKRNLFQKIFLPSITKKIADRLIKPMLVFPSVYQPTSLPA